MKLIGLLMTSIVREWNSKVKITTLKTAGTFCTLPKTTFSSVILRTTQIMAKGLIAELRN